jgi:hypothetical protein
MRVHFWRASLIGVLLSSVAATADFSPVALGVRPGEYFGVIYAAPAREDAPYVFYEGEPIQLEIDLVNSGSAPVSIPVSGTAAARLFKTSITRDGSPAAIGVDFDESGVVIDSSGDARRAPADRLVLTPGQRFSLKASVRSSSVQQPGLYVVDVSTGLTDADGRAIRPEATRFDFELRARNADGGAELARRDAMRALVTKDFGQAERVAAQMLAANAKRFAPWVIRGDIAASQGRSPEAAAMYQRALDLLETNGDVEYLRWANGLTREEDISGLRTIIRTHRGR